MLLLLRVWAVSSYDVTTALGIVAANGITTALIGFALTLFDGFVIGTMTLSLLFITETSFKRSPRLSQFRWAAALLFAGGAIVAPWYSALMILGFVGATRLHEARRKTSEPVKRGRVFKSAAGLSFVGLVVTTVLSSQMWIPSESLTRETTDGALTEVAYVLEEEGRWTTILRDEGRTLALVPSSQLRERRICKLQPVAPSVLAILTKRTTATPDC